MKRNFAIHLVVLAIFAAITMLTLTHKAGAVQEDKKIRLLDDCESVSFNNRFGDGICVGNGKTTVDDFLAEIEATQQAHKWRNQPSEVLINVGRPTVIENFGGETHTFTQVAEFGGGFFDLLNGISGNPVPAPECVNTRGLTFIPAGGTAQGPIAGSSELPVGTHKFQCCIHPWMRTVIEVAEPAAPQTDEPPMPAHHH
jgi:hypothetical protein